MERTSCDASRLNVVEFGLVKVRERKQNTFMNDSEVISRAMALIGKRGAGVKKTMSAAAKDQRKHAAIASAKARAKKKLLHY